MLQTLTDLEATLLRRSLGDVVALSTLTAVWAGARPLRIAESLSSALYSMLGARSIYVMFTDAHGHPLARLAQFGHGSSEGVVRADLEAALYAWAVRAIRMSCSTGQAKKAPPLHASLAANSVRMPSWVSSPPGFRTT